MAYSIFHDMIEKGNTPDVVSYNAHINRFCKSSRVGEGMHLYKEMLQSGSFPDKVTCKLIIGALIRGKKLSDACRVWDQMMEKGFTLDRAVSETLINAIQSREPSLKWEMVCIIYNFHLQTLCVCVCLCARVLTDTITKSFIGMIFYWASSGLFVIGIGDFCSIQCLHSASQLCNTTGCTGLQCPSSANFMESGIFCMMAIMNYSGWKFKFNNSSSFLMPIMNDKVKWSDFNRRLFAKWPQTNDGS